MKIDEKLLEMFMARLCLRKQDLAKISGVSAATISKVMSGYEVSARTAGRIAKGMGLEVEEILMEG
jgi:plasmid maintenance system antidote protein VapI